MFEELSLIFNNASGLITIICLLVGCALIVAEIFLPNFGVCGISGIVFVVFAIAYRVYTGATFIQTVILILLTIIVLFIITMLLSKSIKSGLLSKTSLFNSKPSIPNDYGEKNYNKVLIGKVGTAITDLRPIGKCNIDGEIYDVLSDDKYIDKGSQIKVKDVDIDKLIVLEI